MNEGLITFKQFSHQDAFNFGLRALKIVEAEQLKPLRIRVMIDGDIVFQYLMDGKTSDLWLNLKENTVKASKHSSMYVFKHQTEFKELLNNDEYAICGGGYPLVINDEIRGIFSISGLEHQDDHGLIVRILNEMKQ